MSHSKLSLSKCKAARPRQSRRFQHATHDNDESVTKHVSSLASFAQATGEPATVSKLELNGLELLEQQGKGTNSSNVLFSLLDDDSEWESDVEPSQNQMLRSDTHYKGRQAVGSSKEMVGADHFTAENPTARGAASAPTDTHCHLREALNLEDEDIAIGFVGGNLGRHCEGNTVSLLPAQDQSVTHSQTPQHRKRSFDREQPNPTGGNRFDETASCPQRNPALYNEFAAGNRQAEGIAVTTQQTRQGPAAAGSAEPGSCSHLVAPTRLEEFGRPGSAGSGVHLSEHRDMLEWLQAIRLEQYLQTFVQEEIDLSILHALSASDLASIGITHEAHQGAILAAAKTPQPFYQQAPPGQHRSCGAGLHPPLRDQHATRMPQPSVKLGQEPMAVGGGASAPEQQPLQTVEFPASNQPQPSGTKALFVDDFDIIHQQQQQQHEQQHPQLGVRPSRQQRGPLAAPSLPKGVRSGRGSHQSLLQVWQANAAPEALASASSAHNVSTEGGVAGMLGKQRKLGHIGGNAGNKCQALGAQELVSGSEWVFKTALSVAPGSTGTRLKEQELFVRLYPVSKAQTGATDEARSAHVAPSLLRPSTACKASRVPANNSLWRAAGDCQRVLPSMEERLNKRRAEQGLQGEAPEKLARGGTAYPQVDESRALKLVKLDALRQELAKHEETVADLRRIIKGMERELGLG